MDIKDKKVTVIGLGKSGFSAAKLLKNRRAEVKVTDLGEEPEVKKRAEELSKIGIEVEIGQHTKEFLEGRDLLVVSPGVSDDSFPLRYAYENDIPVIGEVELGYRFCNTPIIAISGTNGKTTVATMLNTILRKIGVNSVLCGNVGTPITEIVRNIDNQKPSFLVLEISSFQLNRIKKFRPFIGILLDVTRDHLDRHNSEYSYRLAKYNLFSNQTKDDWAIIVNPEEQFLKKRQKFVYFNDMEIESASCYFHKNYSNFIDRVYKTENIDINKKIVLVVLSLLKQNIRDYFKDVLGFENLPHRLEFVSKIKGISFINDSKSTNISSTVWALKKFDRVILIAGGRNKNLDFKLAPGWIKNKLKHVVVMGESAEEIKNSFKDFCPVLKVKGLREAVINSYNLSKPGDNVLLSPMCSSFDMFDNYENRGNVFKREVDKLKRKENT